MKRILITGAGGSPATNFVRSLRDSKEKFHLVGIDADKYYLMRAETDTRYLVPSPEDPNYFPVLNKIIKKEKIDFIHVQNDFELGVLNENRDRLEVKYFWPNPEVIKLCQDKFRSFEVWKKAGLKVPDTVLVRNEDDLKAAFQKFGGEIWIRAISGAGGKGSLPARDLKGAKSWIDLHNGWGSFTASELLMPESTTWMSIWYNGKLIVAQGRKRLYWELAKISPSGITGAKIGRAHV